MMKKILLLLAIILPTTARADFSLGPVAGISLSTVTVSNSGVSVSLDNQVGFAGGVTTEWDFHPNFSLQPEILYVGKGGALSLDTSKLHFHINYLDVPVLAKGKIPLGDKARLYGLFGPALAFKLNTSASVDGNTLPQTGDDGVKSTDFGLHFGLGADAKFSESFTGFVDVRYEYGLIDVIKARPGTSDTSVAKNRSWMFLVGGRFGL